MEIAGFVVAVLAVIAAGASVLYAKGANSRAEEANRTAAHALDFQKRIDEREREFRDVSWGGRWDDLHGAQSGPPVFMLKNTGLTPARGIVLVIEMPSGPQAFDLGDLDVGEERGAELRSEMRGAMAAAVLQLHGLQYRVHWSSPLGQADRYAYSGPQIF